MSDEQTDTVTGAEKVAADPDGIDTIKTDPAPQTGADQASWASLTASADQNGTDEPLPAAVDPIADELSTLAADEVEKIVPSIPPEAEAALKSWLRTNIAWVQAELEHAKIGTPVADRAKLNP